MAAAVMSVQPKQQPTQIAPVHATSARAVPSCPWRAHWLTVSEFSHLMGRPAHTVYTWIERGTLAEFGIPTFQFRGSKLRSGRVFIQNVF
jgi:hypothetical protein